MGELDEYDAAMLDERDYGDIDVDTRMAAEARMSARDRREGRGRGRLAAMLESDGASCGVGAPHREPNAAHLHSAAPA